MALFGFGAKKTAKNFFNKDIEPSCSYCERGKRTANGTKIFCEKRGPVELTDKCKEFSYSPLKRVPVKQVNIPGNFDDEEEATAE